MYLQLLQTVTNRLATCRPSTLAAIMAFALTTAGSAYGQNSVPFYKSFAPTPMISWPAAEGFRLGTGLTTTIHSEMVIDYVSLAVQGPNTTSCLVRMNVINPDSTNCATYYFLLVPTTVAQGHPTGGVNQVTRIYAGYSDRIDMDFSACGPPNSVVATISGFISISGRLTE